MTKYMQYDKVSTHIQLSKVCRTQVFTYIQSDKACLLTDSRPKCSQTVEQSVTAPGVHLHTEGQGVFTHRQQTEV